MNKLLIKAQITGPNQLNNTADPIIKTSIPNIKKMPILGTTFTLFTY